MTQSRRSFMKKAGLGFLYLTTACTKADIYVGEFDFDDEDISSDPSDPSDPSNPSNPSNPSVPSNPSNNFSVFNKSWEEIYNQEVYNHYNAQFKNADDYAKKVYIDPTYQGGDSDGTFERPFLSLLDVSSEPNTAYLVKRGTSHSIAFEAPPKYFRMLSSADVMLGAYGEGTMPVVTGNTLEFMGDRTLIRDIQVPTIRLGKYGGPGSDNSTIFNCILDGSNETVLWGVNFRVIGCEIKNSNSNGIFTQQVDLSKDSDVEIAYCWIHKVNQAWFGNGTDAGRLDQVEAWGDPIHISAHFKGHFWVHHNILDRKDTGNKFCFIINTFDDVPISGVFENNICFGPRSHPSTGNMIYLDGTPGAPLDIIVRNNVLIGTYDAYSDSWTNCGIYINHAKVEVYGNIIGDMQQVIFRWNNDGGDSYFYNNTCFRIFDDQELSANLAGVHNNIFSKSSMNISGAHTRGNNIYLNDPLTLPENVFIDPASGNYGLKENSHVLNAGTWEQYMNTEWTRDIAGNNVPHNDSINIGALQ